MQHKKILECLQNEYIFSELKEDDDGQENLFRDKPTKTILFKWTNTCERCYKRGHLSINCHGPKRNKKFQK